jgi:hypothetical protein
MKFVSDIRLLLIGLWLGSACFFIAVAQSAFAVLPARELAGAVVNRTLSVLSLSGLVIGVVLLLLTFATTKTTNIFLLWSERLLLLIVAVACAANQFVIGWWLSSVRAQMGRPIDEIAADDPLRLRFDQLHEYSVWVLLAAMAAALLAFFVIANRRFGKAASAAPPLGLDFEKHIKL